MHGTMNIKLGGIEKWHGILETRKSLDHPGIQTSDYAALILVPYRLRYTVSLCYFVWMWNRWKNNHTWILSTNVELRRLGELVVERCQVASFCDRGNNT